MSPSDKSRSRLNELSRRRWLQAVGTGGVVGLAGCLTGDDTEGTSTDRYTEIRSGGDHYDELNWNPYGAAFNTDFEHSVSLMSAQVREGDGEVTLLGYEDWDYDVGTGVIEVTLRDDLLFWNGDDYTADDFHAFQEMERALDPDASDYESIEVVDDRTVEFTLKEPTNEVLVELAYIPGVLFSWGEEVWGEWAERFNEAEGDEDENLEIFEDLLDFEITTEELVEEGWGSGAYIIDDITEEYMDMVAFEDHYLHQGNDDRFDPNIDRVRYLHADESGRRDQLLTNEQASISYHEQQWEDFEAVMPDHWEELVYNETGNFRKLLINWRNREYLQDKNVRRAMAAAIDFENIGENTGEFPVEAHTGVAELHNEEYYGEAVPDEMIQYGLNTDEDLADEFLERSGYERDDDTIYDPNGDELEPLRVVLGDDPWRTPGDVAANQLESYGFPVDITDIDRSSKLETIVDPANMTTWDLSTETHNFGNTRHPSEFFWYDTFWGWRLSHAQFGPESEFSLDWVDDQTHSPYNGKPNRFEIPADVGEEELNGDTIEVNIVELVDEIETPIDEERDQEIMEMLMWAWNYTLPSIQLTSAVANWFGNTRDFDWEDSSEVQAYHPVRLPELGVVRFAE